MTALKNNNEFMLNTIAGLKTLSTSELALLVVEIGLLRSLLCYDPRTDEAYHYECVTIIDDSIQLIIDPKETF